MLLPGRAAFEDHLGDERHQREQRQQRRHRECGSARIFVVEHLDVQRHGVGLPADVAGDDGHRAKFAHGAGVAEEHAVEERPLHVRQRHLEEGAQARGAERERRLLVLRALFSHEWNQFARDEREGHEHGREHDAREREDDLDVVRLEERPEIALGAEQQHEDEAGDDGGDRERQVDHRDQQALARELILGERPGHDHPEHEVERHGYPRRDQRERDGGERVGIGPVSYTHLDVYKRQERARRCRRLGRLCRGACRARDAGWISRSRGHRRRDHRRTAEVLLGRGDRVFARRVRCRDHLASLRRPRRRRDRLLLASGAWARGQNMGLHLRFGPSRVAGGERAHEIAVLLIAGSAVQLVLPGVAAKERKRQPHQLADLPRQHFAAGRLRDDQVEARIVRGEGDEVDRLLLCALLHGCAKLFQFGERRIADAGGGAGRCPAFQHRAHPVDLARVIERIGAHVGAAVAAEHDEPFGLKLQQRLAHRRAARPQRRRDLGLAQMRAGGKAPPHDVVSDISVDPLGRAAHLALISWQD